MERDLWTWGAAFHYGRLPGTPQRHSFTRGDRVGVPALAGFRGRRAQELILHLRRPAKAGTPTHRSAHFLGQLQLQPLFLPWDLPCFFFFLQPVVDFLTAG